MFSDGALSIAFLLSGAAGLMFQVVWFHRASLVLGSSLWAVTIVLSAFMGGIAMGNAAAPVLRTRFARPLRTYVWLELVVAVSGLAVSLILPHLGALMAPISRALSGSPWAVNMVRLCAAFVVLAVPATAMGATLPILVAALRPRGWGSFGATLGQLYGWNTSGALLGVLAAEAFFIRYVGVGGTAFVAAAFSLSAAALAALVSRGRADTLGEVVAGDWPAVPPPPIAVSDRERPVPQGFVIKGLPHRKEALPVLLCAGFAGGLLLALEVVWFRFLSLFVLSTTLAASLMLAAVLGGISAGGFLGSLWIRRRPGALIFVPVVAFAAGATLAGGYASFDSLTSGTQVGEWWRVLWFALALTGPTSLLSGVLFTLLGEILYREVGSAVVATARLTLANTIGAMLGPPIATFVLLPWIGLERTLFVLATTYGGVGLFALATMGLRTSRTQAIVAAAAAVWALILLVFPHGAMQTRYFARAASAYVGDGSTIVATRESPSETIFLMQQRWMGKPVYSRLVTNGFSMTGTAVPGMRYMRYFAYWPMLVHSGPIKEALLVCYGVGVTAGAVLQIPGLQSLDVAEISRDIVAMSDLVYEPSVHPLRDPRVAMHIEDGRYFLATTEKRFDLITGEPPPPRSPGTVNIYSREYFALIYDHLNEGGIATYWVPVARPNPGTDVDTIIRAFCDVFEDCSLWNATPFDLMLAGSRHGGAPVTADAFSQPWLTPGLQASLREVGFERPEQIGATFLGDAAYLHRLTEQTPPLTDDFPQRLRPDPSRPSLSDPNGAIDPAIAARFQEVISPERAQGDFVSSPFIGRLWPATLLQATLPYFASQHLLNRVIWEGARPLAHIDDLHTLLTTTTLRTLPLWMLGSDDVKQRIVETSGDDGTGAADYARALRALSGRDYQSAAANFVRAEGRGLKGPPLRSLLAFALYMSGRSAEARLLSAQAPAGDAEARLFWTWIRKRF